jgi:hypothetical protein
MIKNDPDPSSSSHVEGSLAGGNTSEKESDTLEESEHDYASSSFQEFHTEIRRMSKDADQLLDSFRQEVLGQQHRKNIMIRRKSPKNLEDDDSFSDEERRLEEVTAAIRVSLDSKTTDSMDNEYISPLRNPCLTTNNNQHHDDPTQTTTTTSGKREHFTFVSPSTVSYDNRSTTATIAKHSDFEFLLLTVTIIWAIVAAFLVHAKFYLIDENGRIHFPLENWFR